MGRREQQRAWVDAIAERVGPASQGATFLQAHGNDPALVYWAGVLVDPTSSDADRIRAALEVHERMPPTPELAATRRHHALRCAALPEAIQELYKLGTFAVHPPNYFG